MPFARAYPFNYIPTDLCIQSRAAMYPILAGLLISKCTPPIGCWWHRGTKHAVIPATITQSCVCLCSHCYPGLQWKGSPSTNRNIIAQSSTSLYGHHVISSYTDMMWLCYYRHVWQKKGGQFQQIFIVPTESSDFLRFRWILNQENAMYHSEVTSYKYSNWLE